MPPAENGCSAAADQSHRLAIQRAIRTMHAGLDRRLSLKDLAAVAYISPFHFIRIFHRIVGMPPGHFLSALRIQEAKRLLITTRQKVIDICLDVGFASPGTFSRRFRAFVGLSPFHLRRLARGLTGSCWPLLSLAGFECASAEAGPLGVVSGPEGFIGLIFVGLFDSPMPQSRPVGYAILQQPGAFQVRPVPDGRYYLLSLAFPLDVEARELLLCESALRGGSVSEPVVVRSNAFAAPTQLMLRPAEVTDPPILLTLPWLMSQLPAAARPRAALESRKPPFEGSAG